jgi:hypothetical protein
MDVLDHSSRGFTYGSKMGIDATRKWKEEGFDREWPERIVMDEETKRRVDGMWSQLGIALLRGRNGGTEPKARSPKATTERRNDEAPNPPER